MKNSMWRSDLPSGNPKPWRQWRSAGFSLLDVSIAMAIVALVLAAGTPVMLKQAQIRQADRTAQEMLLIGDAAKFWYKDHGATWPADITTLKNEGYLPSGFSGASPFGTSYVTVVGTPNFTVKVELPADLATAVSTKLPLSTVTPAGATATVSYEMPPPGSSADGGISDLAPQSAGFGDFGGPIGPGDYFFPGELTVSKDGRYLGLYHVRCSSGCDTGYYGTTVFRGGVNIGTFTNGTRGTGRATLPMISWFTGLKAGDKIRMNIHVDGGGSMLVDQAALFLVWLGPS